MLTSHRAQIWISSFYFPIFNTSISEQSETKIKKISNLVAFVAQWGLQPIYGQIVSKMYKIGSDIALTSSLAIRIRYIDKF